MSTNQLPTQFGELLFAAIRAYEEKAKAVLDDADILDNLLESRTVEGTLEVLEGGMSEFARFRQGDLKWLKLVDKMKTIINVVLVLNDTVAELASSLPLRKKVPGGKAVFVALSVLLTATKGQSDRYDALEELFARHVFFLNRLNVRLGASVAFSDGTKKIFVDILLQLLETLSLSKKLLMKNRFVHYMQTLFGNRDMKAALDELDKLTAQEMQMTATATLGTVTQTLVATKEVSEKITQVEAIGQENRRTLQKIGATVERQHNFQVGNEIRHWLSPPDPSTNHNNIVTSRHEGTGAWIFQRADFVDWKSDGCGFYWIHGKAGSGKSVLWFAPVPVHCDATVLIKSQLDRY
ncbi:hypothetical protein K488DRAFT_73898 [Vararia minispora EC-137]|uniref:Uncharacterized protein n=1 Tax=Vararia minispora EC-137 TaxID=1314806 RepID=A0ACB8Q9K0_9AGAM|nr:hypothetical protein K488DRAFT_73898 [Vararia minispora EC-137]